MLTCDPIALEGLDDKLVDFQREKHLNPKALHLLPEGNAWLLVQLGGQDQHEADRNADRLLATIGRRRDDDDVAFFDEPGQEEELWEVRESALGATARIPGQADTWPGWEDSAVDPSRLGDYLRDLYGLYEEYGYTEASLYGHFGQGCVHTRIPFDMFTADGVSQFRSFLERAADLVASYGGSLSGEHGDGQARGELLARDVRRRDRRGVRADEGDLRPGRPDEPRQGRRPRPAGPAPAPRHRLPPCGPGHRVRGTPTTTATSAGPCCAASGWASAAGRAAA